MRATMVRDLPGTIRSRPWLADGLLGISMLALGLIMLEAAAPVALSRVSPASIVWTACGIVPMALRRQRPWIAVALVLVSNSVVLLPPSVSGIEVLDAGMPLLVVAYSVAAWLPVRQAVAATTVLWGFVLACLAYTIPTASPERREELGQLQGAQSVSAMVCINLMIALMIFFIGRTIWTRRAYAAALEDRAAVAEANQRTLAVQAVAAERRRIARELHDVVAHHISVMSVLASGARRDPAAADEAMATIEQTGRTVLREMRRLLDVLRADDQDGEDQLAPQPGLATVTALVEQVRETGLSVRFTCDPAIGDVGPGLALTVYRILQEGLTNVIKHAGPSATVDVRLKIDEGTLELEIADTGRGPTPDGAKPGHGLLGMRERVALFNGQLRVGPRPGGGYRLCARIPVDPGHDTHRTPLDSAR